jgi:hypothetical protein
MKYIVTVRSRPHADDGISSKHDRFMAGIRTLPSPWAPESSDWPGAADPGEDYLTVIKLARIMGEGVKGSLNYRNRRVLLDEAQSDDWIRLEFNPEKVDYPALLRSAFERYVTVLGAYVGDIKDARFIANDFERWQRSKIDYRQNVFRIYPVNFFDRELCKRAFALRPEDIAARLTKEVERVDLVNNGVLIVVDSKILPFKEAEAIDRRLRPLLAARK